MYNPCIEAKLLGIMEVCGFQPKKYYQKLASDFLFNSLALLVIGIAKPKMS